MTEDRESPATGGQPRDDRVPGALGRLPGSGAGTLEGAAPLADGLLQVEELRTYFDTDEGTARAVDGVSFRMSRGRTLGLVGESGCGKSVTALSILRLVPSPPGRIASGRILFEGRDLLRLSGTEMRQVRGDRIAMVFQEPMTSLNPVFTVGNQVIEAILFHQKVTKAEARAQTVELLRRVHLPAPEERADAYPHQLSGGMKQRVMIAMALACRPDLLIADEPTTALDVTVAAQILDLLKELQADFGMSVLLITHDMGVVAETTDEVAVMYAGQLVETGSTRALFARPRHPYTIGLFRSLPSLGREQRRLAAIPGAVPSPLHFPAGCRFHPRCFLSQGRERCRREEPDLRALVPAAGDEPAHVSRCHFAEAAAEVEVEL
jgi:oligopeptide/dipeptide ABC transporter ATP-binding protein